jgi:hypothetical protein
MIEVRITPFGRPSPLLRILTFELKYGVLGRWGALWRGVLRHGIQWCRCLLVGRIGEGEEIAMTRPKLTGGWNRSPVAR